MQDKFVWFVPIVLLTFLSVPAKAQIVPRWQYFTVTADGPTLMYLESQRDTGFTISCRGTTLRVGVNGFTPAQSWPQPVLSLHFGTVMREKTPDAALSGASGIWLSTQFNIADSVLTALRTGKLLSASFHAQQLTFPAVPEDIGSAFADGCAALVPAGMRSG